MRISPKLLFEHCYGKYGIAAVNVFTMEQVLGLFSAAQKAGAPFIVQITPAARNYAHPVMLKRMVTAAAEIFPDTCFAIHLDHGDEHHVGQAIGSGDYASVMIDASHAPYEENVSRTKNVVDKAKPRGIFVEAELGVLSGVEDHLQVDEKSRRYTQPLQAEDFVKRTGCDSLAVAVGTSHGAYKFSGTQGLQFDILEEIQNRLPGFPLVLHGASAVKPEEISGINAAGGKLGAHAQGVDPAALKKAIAYGVCKVNIATDLRLIWTRVYREFFRDHPDRFDPVLPGKDYIRAIETFMLEKFE
ncbi:MAG: class II fructose-bisphosphate aldolase family protein, partial [Mangrovibacterium sp.]|nr:class II fructose-bisphosphate aldolase family protein [Mangrovibacterium sp.]